MRTSQTGQALTHTTHGGYSQDSRGPQPVRAAPASHAMYIHIAGGLPGPRSADCASEQRWRAAAPGRGCRGLPPDPGPGTLSAPVEPGGKAGRVCRGRPEQRLGRARGTQCPAVRFAHAHGLRRQDHLGHPSVCLLTSLPPRVRGLPQGRGRCGLASSPPALLVPDTSTERGSWRKGRRPVPGPVPGQGTAPALEGRAHMSVSCLASCPPPTAGPWPGPSHVPVGGTLLPLA